MKKLSSRVLDTINMLCAAVGAQRKENAPALRAVRFEQVQIETVGKCLRAFSSLRGKRRWKIVLYEDGTITIVSSWRDKHGAYHTTVTPMSYEGAASFLWLHTDRSLSVSEVEKWLEYHSIY